MDVMFYEVFAEEKQVLKKLLSKNTLAGFTSKTIQAHNRKIPPATLISTRTQSRIPHLWADTLKGVLSRTTGYDHLINFLRETKIPCGYLQPYSSRAVAEHAIMVMLALKRHLKKQMRHFDQFNRDYLTGRQSLGKRILVVGVGNIGTEIFHMAKGLGMLVQGVDLKPAVKGLKYVSLKKGIAWADVLVCTLPLTEKTKGLLNYDLLRRARTGLIFVNISRGEISPVSDLDRLLKKGTIGGLGLDVYPNEHKLADHLRRAAKSVEKDHRTILQWRHHDHVILTPHNAFNTHEALYEKCHLTVSSVMSFLKNGRFPCPVKN